jgi:hypothetical protein
MIVEMQRSYQAVGLFDLDTMSDEVLGAVTRAMLCKAREDDNYQHVTITVQKPAAGEEEKE